LGHALGCAIGAGVFAPALLSIWEKKKEMPDTYQIPTNGRLEPKVFNVVESEFPQW